MRGIDQLVIRETQIPVQIADDPLTTVVRGAGIVLEDLEMLREVLVLTEFEQIPR
ncbi:MAG: Cell shape determining protein, MreB/Mrl family [Parcubacteria group bacterium GW2011_GWA2_52_8]|nr:MAG: Cell shape determining protein, MreB/Mrl family [Parcubacteria group bacterium GW2011_GWA2_52_8]